MNQICLLCLIVSYNYSKYRRLRRRILLKLSSRNKQNIFVLEASVFLKKVKTFVKSRIKSEKCLSVKILFYHIKSKKIYHYEIGCKTNLFVNWYNEIHQLLINIIQKNMKLFCEKTVLVKIKISLNINYFVIEKQIF